VPDVSLALYNSSQQSSVTTAISRLTGTNLTNTMEGLRTAIPPMTAAFADTSRASRKAVLLVTDGQPTALRLSSIAACQVDPVKYPLTIGSGINNLVAAAWTINAGCWFQYSAPGLRRNQLNSTPSPNSTITTTTPALSPAQLLYQHMMSATRNSARDEAYQLRALGGGNLIVFVIGIGPSNASVTPDARLDANARCLLGSIANDPDVITDPSTNNFTGGCAGVYQTGSAGNDLDPHADLRQATAGGTPFGVISGQLNGNLYTVDFTDPAGVTPQLQNIFGQIAAILKLRLTI